MARRAYVGITNYVSRGLPPGYAQAAYIESNGTQHIDTLIKDGENAAYEIAFTPLDGGPDYQTYFGHDKWRTPWLQKSGSTSYLSVKNLYGSTNVPITFGEKLTAIYNVDGTFTLNGEVIDLDFPHTGYGWWSPTTWVFNSASEHNLGANMRLHALKMWTDGVLVRDYVPCINPNGECGVYDMVEGKFYGNGGTGVFEPGVTAESTARTIRQAYIGVYADRIKHYEMLESITAPGTAGFDTGIFAKSGLDIEIDFQFTEFGETINTYQMLIHGGTGWMENHLGMNFYGNDSYHLLYLYYENDRASTSRGDKFFDAPLSRHLFRIQGNQLYVDGTLLLTAPSDNAFESSAPMGLLCSCAPDGYYYFCSGVLYSCRIRDGGELVADIVPAKRLTDGVVGVYDRISGAFLDRVGRGEFEAGAKTGEYIYKNTGYIAARRIKKIYDSDGGTARLLWEA